MAILILRPNTTAYDTLATFPQVPNWQNVDDVSPDGGTSVVFVAPSMSDRYDLYGITNPPSYIGGTINSIKVYICTQGDYDDSVKERIKIKTHGVIYDSPEFGQEDNWHINSHIWNTNPNTGLTWTWDEIETLLIGIWMEPPVCITGNANCTQIYVEIDYEAIPVVTSSATTNIEETASTGNGNITDIGDSEVTKRGICWNTTGNPTVADSKSEETGSFGTGSFSRSMTGLTPGQKYYVRAYAYNSEGYGYSDVRTFVTKPNPPTTLACSVISSTQIDLTWTKGSGAEKTMVRRKIGSYPTSPTDGDQAYFGPGESFSDNDLTRLTHYFYRAWSYKTDAPNSGYSDEYSSDDDSTPAELATVVTEDATGILQSQATGNGEITDTGGVDVTTRGFKYALTKDPLNDVHEDGTYGIGEYSKVISKLQGNTEYWYCAYATNSIGTAYGAWVKFKTPATGTVPTGTKINICGDYTGYTYELNKSLTDDGNEYESYFTLSTDLMGKQGLHIYKRLEDLFSYFEKKESGTCKIYIKRDNEATWQYAGEVSMTGDENIIIKHLPSDNEDTSGDVDFLAKHFLIKFVLRNDFEFIGLITESVQEGVR